VGRKISRTSRHTEREAKRTGGMANGRVDRECAGIGIVSAGARPGARAGYMSRGNREGKCRCNGDEQVNKV
jgi:hypothetical protein